MQRAVPVAAPVASRWSSRVALFGVCVLLAAFILHRSLGMPTPTAAILFAVSLGCALLAILLSAIAWVRIWRRGAEGTARIVFSCAVSLSILAIPLFTVLLAAGEPVMNDVTTDFVSPPEFVALAKERPPGSNAPGYQGARVAEVQADAYPDIKPLAIPRSAEESFELVVDAVKRMKMQIVRQEAPDSAAAAPGYIEASDRTLIMGFYDDVTVRVMGDDQVSRVDMRSQSRFGRGDLGRNAERLRQLAYEIQLRVDATMPAPGEERVRKKPGEQPAKRAKGDDRKQEPRRKTRDPER
jgi:uncharacterized protein (DUF1499 family)